MHFTLFNPPVLPAESTPIHTLTPEYVIANRHHVVDEAPFDFELGQLRNGYKIPVPENAVHVTLLFEQGRANYSNVLRVYLGQEKFYNHESFIKEMIPKFSNKHLISFALPQGVSMLFFDWTRENPTDELSAAFI
ncbi:hypothetical protein AB6D33_24925 [Vibrio splendidus]